jgi:hypothetical protein
MRLLAAQADAAHQQQKTADAWADAHIHPEPAQTPPALPGLARVGSPFSQTKR